MGILEQQLDLDEVIEALAEITARPMLEYHKRQPAKLQADSAMARESGQISTETALPGYYTTEEAANSLGHADGSYLRRLCMSGRIRGYKVGKTWLIPAEDFAVLCERKGRKNNFSFDVSRDTEIFQSLDSAT